MSLITKPKLENRQFEQPLNSTLDMSGTTNFLGVLKSKGIEIDASISGDTINFDGYALVYDNDSGKIVLRENIDRYTGTAERTVGGIREGQGFTGATMTEMWDMLIKEEKGPTFTQPSINFTSSITGFREIGEKININFNTTFNRGIINYSYKDNEPYSGNVEKYVYTGPNLNVETNTTSLNDSKTLNDYTVVIGQQIWNCTVHYLQGVQPLTSYGNTQYYDINNNLIILTPLSGGTKTSVNRIITGVYPFFATTSNITTLTKKPLQAHGSVIDVTMVAENISNKQKLEVPNVWGALNKIEQFNDLSGQWDVIDINSFTQSSTNRTINGIVVDYTTYTHNGSLIGSRRLRFTF